MRGIGDLQVYRVPHGSGGLSGDLGVDGDKSIGAGLIRFQRVHNKKR